MRMIQEEHKIAEELLDATSHFHPNHILPWTLLGKLKTLMFQTNKI